MEVVHLTNPPGADSDSRRLAQRAGSKDGARNQRQLATRWNVSEARLSRWRSRGIGPKFLKLCARVLYRQIDIEAYEASCLATSTKSRGTRVDAE